MKAEISMPQVVKGLTIRAVVTGRRRTAIRLWLGCRVMVLGAWVIGCGIDVSADFDR
jgi:hypothetical protein